MRNNGRYFVGISLSVPIFDAMRTADNVAQARLRYSDQQIALRKVDKEMCIRDRGWADRGGRSDEQSARGGV